MRLLLQKLILGEIEGLQGVVENVNVVINLTLPRFSFVIMIAALENIAR